MCARCATNGSCLWFLAAVSKVGMFASAEMGQIVGRAGTEIVHALSQFQPGACQHASVAGQRTKRKVYGDRAEVVAKPQAAVYT